MAFIRYPGLQNDELFFAPPIFAPQTAFYSIKVGALRIPLMVMSYTGALKTWLYTAIFSVWEPSAWSVRIPVALLGVITIWLTWIWVRSIGGRLAAIAATAMLATDAMFLLTGVFDWGPVALQHVFLMAGLVCVTRYVKTGSHFALASGFVLWGLGLWDKALLIWPLAGLALAAIAVFPREVLRRLKPAPMVIASLSLLAGAAPLVWFNLDRHGETASANAVFSTNDYGQKAHVLLGGIDGSLLFGYMTDERADRPYRPPRGMKERWSFAVRRATGVHARNWFLPAFGAAMASLFWLRRSEAFRPMLFVLIAGAAAWVQMFITHNAGAGAHHIVLIWPFPFVFTGLALAALARCIPRFGAAAFAGVVCLLVLGNLLNVNEYFARFAIRGGIGGWTDAIYPLSSSLGDEAWTGMVDWGYTNGLRVLHEGRMKLFAASAEAAKPQLSAADLAQLKKIVETPGFLFVEHTSGKEMIPGINEKLRRRAAELGYSEQVQERIEDSSGDPVFEIFRFVKAHESGAFPPR